MLPRQYMMLFGITITAFIFNTSEFMPIALLIDISESFSMTEAATGQMITIYAWVVALLSLPLMLLTCRMELKKLLLLMVALFGIGQMISGVATSYEMLLGARIVVACAHSIFWSIAAPLATRLVTREHQPTALGMIVTGSSVATIVGLPLGRVIGLAAGWRMTFEQRALPSTTNEGDFHVYCVERPIDGVQKGKIAPWFGRMGGGIQYKLPDRIVNLMEASMLREVDLAEEKEAA